MDYSDIIEELPVAEAEFRPSFAFSLHKNGSSLFFGMLSTVCHRAGIPGASIPDAIFQNGVADKEWETAPEILSFLRRRMLHYGFRYLPAGLEDDPTILQGKRFVILVRDPRDALVSQYFSFGRRRGSHVLPAKRPEAYQRMLDNLPEVGIDEYVLGAAPLLKNRLEAYRRALEYTNGLVYRYEDAYYDKERLLRAAFAHWQISVPDDVLIQTSAVFDIRPSVEDDSKHIRQGTPGDHLRKLAPETVAGLNDRLGDVAAFFGYDL